MVLGVLAYIFVRPFVRAGLDKRHELAAAQRSERTIARERVRRARANGPITWTPEEKEYLAAHTVSPYR